MEARPSGNQYEPPTHTLYVPGAALAETVIVSEAEPAVLGETLTWEGEIAAEIPDGRAVDNPSPTPLLNP